MTHGSSIRVVCALVALSLGSTTFLTAQPQAPAAGTFEFDVASVRPMPLATHGRINDILPSPVRVLPGDRFQTEHAWLRSLIAFAYGFERTVDRIRGGGPMLNDTFEVVARGVPGSFAAASPDDLQPVRHMVQGLLAERFNLQVHAEREERRVLLLKRVSPITLGVRLRPLPGGCRMMTPFSATTASDDGLPRCEWSIGPDGALAATGTSREFATSFGNYLARDVLDETGLRGFYQFAIKFDPDTIPRPPELSAAMRTGRHSELQEFRTALKSDLGLVLEDATRSVPVLVITHLEPLKEN